MKHWFIDSKQQEAARIVGFYVEGRVIDPYFFDDTVISANCLAMLKKFYARTRPDWVTHHPIRAFRYVSGSTNTFRNGLGSPVTRLKSIGFFMELPAIGGLFVQDQRSEPFASAIRDGMSHVGLCCCHSSELGCSRAVVLRDRSTFGPPCISKDDVRG